MNMLFQVIAAAIGVIAFAVLFRAPRKYYLDCGIAGGIGWLIYLIVIGKGFSSMVASLVATLVLTILSRILSVIRLAPVTIFLITSIFTLVPGAGIYYTAYYLMIDDLAMAALKGVETLKVAGAISLGILLGMGIPQGAFRQIKRLHVYLIDCLKGNLKNKKKVIK